MVMNPGLDRTPINITGGDTGILLLHGYTGAPPELRPMAEFLGERGMTVVAPLLPGHGTTPEDLNTRSWREVAQAASEALYDLQSRCSTVFVGGLSMGALLTLHLGQRASGIAGLITMAPALYLRDPLHHLLPLAKYVVSSLPKSRDPKLSVQDMDSAHLLWSYERNPLAFAAEVLGLMHSVRDNLNQIRQPILIAYGAHDRTVPIKAAYQLAEASKHPATELVILSNSGHCVSVDQEREELIARSWQWIAKVAPPAAAALG